ncbi:unnamed protein product [Orchesella dallaii]|uniref:Odorant receptor n=1 Tax=Orchesella dallaii TaxID=48710 RepID=A0ABP1RJV7_9HEXA
MSASIGAMNVMAVISEQINTKLRLDASLNLSVNKNLDTLRGKIEWLSIKMIARLFWLYLLGRLCYLFSNWGQNKDMRELGVQFIFLAFNVIADACMISWEKNYVKFAFVMNQCGNKLGVKLGWPSHKRRPKLPEIEIYLMASCLVALPMIGIGYPLIGKFDPIQCFVYIYFSTVLENNYWLIILLQVICSIFYGLYVLASSIHILYMLLGATCFVEAVTKFSFDVFPSQDTKREQNIKLTTSISEDFQKCYVLYRQLRILVEVGGMGIQTFLQVMIGMGLPLCSFAAFASIKLYEHMNLMVWVGNMMLVPICMMVCSVLVTLASIPNSNSKHYFLTWKRYLYRKFDRKRLASCMELAFNLGAVRRVTHCTALEMCNNVVNSTVTLICMYDS